MYVCKVTTVLVALDVLGVVLQNNPVVWMTGRGGASFKRRSLGQSNRFQGPSNYRVTRECQVLKGVNHSIMLSTCVWIYHIYRTEG